MDEFLKIQQVQIDITNLCNLKCIHCRAYANSYTDEINLKEFQKLIDRLIVIGVERVTISGGEPFLHKNILEFLDYLNNVKLKYVGLTSNGVLLSEKLLSKISKYKDFINIQISLDGFKKLHDENRGIIGTYDIVIKNIHKLLLLGFNISTNITINEKNINEVDDLIKYLINIGVKIIGFRHEIKSGLSEINFSQEFKQKYLLILTKYFCRLKGEYPGIIFNCGDPLKSLVDSRILKNNSFKEIISGNFVGGCSIGIASTYIASNGDIQPCAYVHKKIGNIYTDDLENIWYNSETLNKIRDRESFGGNCGLCHWKYICGGCRADSLADGKMLGEDKICLFNNDQKLIFSNYLKRVGIPKSEYSLVKTKADNNFFMPYWGQVIVELREKKLGDLISSWGKRDVKEINKLEYNYEVSDDIEDLKYFYKNLYMPYSLLKFDDKERILMPYFFIENIFKKNGKIIFVTDNTGKKIGGYLLGEVKLGFYIATTMGIDVDYKATNSKDFISSALYYYILVWGLEQKIDKISYGKTRLYKDDGILKFKQKWGAKIIEPEKDGIYFKPKDINKLDYYKNLFIQAI